MRVVYCTDTYLPQVNGVTVVTELSVRGLIARGWEVEVIAPRYPRQVPGARPHGGANAALARVHSIPSVAAPRYPELRVALPDVWTIAGVIKRARPDIVHCATEFVIGRLGMWAAERYRVPVVTSYHTNFRQYADAYGLGRLAGGVERYIGSVHRRAWRTFTPSDVARGALARMHVHNVDVWGRGVDLNLFSPTRRSATLRTTLGVRSAFTYLYVGRLAPEKDVGTVIRAFAKLREQIGPDAAQLVIAGSGPDEIRLRQMAPAGTVFLGNLDRATQLPELYATADAFAFASTTETLGLVVLEAMASGLPVIAVPAGGVGEHLRHGENGIACPAGDADAMSRAMLHLLTESESRDRLAAGALATAQALGWESELDRLDSAYRRICAEAAAQRELPRRWRRV